jgi:hypothetical protein
MKTLRIGTACLLVAGVSAVACYHETRKETVMRPASGTERSTSTTTTYSTSEYGVGAPKSQPSEVMGTEPSSTAPQTTTGTEATEADTWGSSTSGSATMNPDLSASANQATDRIVAARCDREQKCNNIGASRKYASRSECEANLRSKMADELNFHECKTGINQRQVDKCLTQINGESCRNPLDTLERVVACRSSALCSD